MGGLPPADIEALCQEAALATMDRDAGGHGYERVIHADFEEALERLLVSDRVNRRAVADPETARPVA